MRTPELSHLQQTAPLPQMMVVQEIKPHRLKTKPIPLKLVAKKFILHLLTT
jgi:hypothetical protein